MSKVALITGAGRGIGYGIASKLADEGFNIVIMDIHEASVVADALKGLEAKGVETLYCRADVSKADDRNKMIADVKARFGRLDVLVNNAGVAPRVRADILESSEESFEFVMKINLQGPYFLSQVVANYMIEQKEADNSFDGCIINISSMSASVASPSRGEYCTSKAGVSMMTQLFAARLGEFDIPVYEIRPGIIKTDMTAVVTEKYDNLIFNQGILLQKRWGLPEDIAKVAAMMARGDIGYSTGQVIEVDGGFTKLRL